MSYNGIKVDHIVATDLKGCIGKDGKMPWHIPADLKRFKELTTGGVIIMGRKTFDSLDCKSLPNRMNIVIGSTMSFDDYYRDNKELLYSESINDALMTAKYYAKQKQLDTVWIIGGAEIYAQTMQYADEVLATTVQTRIHGGDAFYDVPPPPFRIVELSDTMTDEKSGLNYRYSKHVRFLSKGQNNE